MKTYLCIVLAFELMRKRYGQQKSRYCKQSWEPFCHTFCRGFNTCASFFLSNSERRYLMTRTITKTTTKKVSIFDNITMLIFVLVAIVFSCTHWTVFGTQSHMRTNRYDRCVRWEKSSDKLKRYWLATQRQLDDQNKWLTRVSGKARWN